MCFNSQAPALNRLSAKVKDLKNVQLEERTSRNHLSACLGISFQSIPPTDIKTVLSATVMKWRWRSAFCWLQLFQVVEFSKAVTVAWPLHFCRWLAHCVLCPPGQDEQNATQRPCLELLDVRPNRHHFAPQRVGAISIARKMSVQRCWKWKNGNDGEVSFGEWVGQVCCKFVLRED